MKKLLLLMSAIMSMLLCVTGCDQGGAAETSAQSSPTAAVVVTATDPATASPVEASPESSQTAAGEQTPDLTGHTLNIYCGAGMTKPFQEIADAFQNQTSCKMEVTYANAGQIQTQINTAKEGDLFIAGSADELAPVNDVVTASKDLVKHIPVLAVKSGNPLGITGLADLANENVRVVLGDADSTPIGKIANKALTDAAILEKVNVVARTTTAPEIFNALTMDECDAIIVWKENVTGSAAEVVETSDMEKYIKTVPAASLSYSDDADALSAFLSFLDTDAAKTIWTNYGYEVLN